MRNGVGRSNLFAGHGDTFGKSGAARCEQDKENEDNVVQALQESVLRLCAMLLHWLTRMASHRLSCLLRDLDIEVDVAARCPKVVRQFEWIQVRSCCVLL
eukprot:7766500-Pyramimonas_sp.AAC.1